MLIATFWFSLMNVFVKLLAHLPTMELVFFRCFVAVILGVIGLKHANVSWKGSNRKLLFLRGLFGTTALYFFFLTIKKMPLGTAVTIQYISPFFSALLAVFLLKESVKPIQWFYFILSFVGVMLIKGFDDRVSWQMLLIGLFSSFFSALAYNMVRTLKEREHPLVIVLHFQFLGAAIGLIFTIFQWQLPDPIDWIYILLLGIFTQLGQVNLTRSLQAENVARVSILNYIGVIYALGFGWLLFGEVNGWPQFIGILLVISGVVFNVLLTRAPETPIPEVK